MLNDFQILLPLGNKTKLRMNDPVMKDVFQQLLRKLVTQKSPKSVSLENNIPSLKPDFLSWQKPLAS